MLTRQSLGMQVAARIGAAREELSAQWRSSDRIKHFVLDDVLPQDWAGEIRRAFPSGDAMTLRRTLREVKYVSAQMDRYDPLLEEAIYAFQSPEIVAQIGEITRLRALEPDERLYAGGISVMGHGHFLNPHIDNSHDQSRQRYRVLNLLFYVSPDWAEAKGANLELWPEGPDGRPVTVVSRFNRLVVMVTDKQSWHSVSKNNSRENRCCVSNYYFSKYPVGTNEYSHVTTFRGRPDQPLRDLLLKLDGGARHLLRRAFPGGIRKSEHYYRK